MAVVVSVPCRIRVEREYHDHSQLRESRRRLRLYLIELKPSKRVVPITVAAEHVGCHSRTIRRYIAAGRLTGYRMGPRLIRVDLAELDALLRPIPTALLRGGA